MVGDDNEHHHQIGDDKKRHLHQRKQTFLALQIYCLKQTHRLKQIHRLIQFAASKFSPNTSSSHSKLSSAQRAYPVSTYTFTKTISKDPDRGLCISRNQLKVQQINLFSPPHDNFGSYLESDSMEKNWNSVQMNVLEDTYGESHNKIIDLWSPDVDLMFEKTQLNQHTLLERLGNTGSIATNVKIMKADSFEEEVKMPIERHIKPALDKGEINLSSIILFARPGEFISIKSCALPVNQNIISGVHHLESFKSKSLGKTIRIDSRLASKVHFFKDKILETKNDSMGYSFEMAELVWTPTIRHYLALDPLGLDKEIRNPLLKRRKIQDLNSNLEKYSSSSSNCMFSLRSNSNSNQDLFSLNQ